MIYFAKTNDIFTNSNRLSYTNPLDNKKHVITFEKETEEIKIKTDTVKSVIYTIVEALTKQRYENYRHSDIFPIRSREAINSLSDLLRDWPASTIKVAEAAFKAELYLGKLIPSASSKLHKNYLAKLNILKTLMIQLDSLIEQSNNQPRYAN